MVVRVTSLDDIVDSKEIGNVWKLPPSGRIVGTT